MKLQFKCKVRQVKDNEVEVIQDVHGLPAPQINIENIDAVSKAWGLSDFDRDQLHDQLFAAALSQVVRASIKVIL